MVYCANFDEVFHATAAGNVQYGVVGVENSTEGVVTRSLDLFLNSPTHVVGEVSLMVRHNLLRQSNSLEGIEVVLAHPQALAQCQAWLSTHLPHAERRAVSSNAEGARLATTNPAWAGLASDRAAAQFNLHVAAPAIQDDASNRTRFAVICLPQTLATPPATGQDCTSLVVSVTNRPGAVHDLLVPLKQNGVSMTRFESRPARTGQWEYYFYIDIQGHPSQPHVAQALADLKALCAFYKVLGTYAVSA
jgi:chorismate mutase/prephenate dehydratase